LVAIVNKLYTDIDSSKVTNTLRGHDTNANFCAQDARVRFYVNILMINKMQAILLITTHVI